MNLVFRTQFGSHVYGTNLPTSDQDFKSIYIPTPKEIILGKTKETIHKDTKSDQSKRNSPTDIDDELFTVKQYIKLLCEGQTVSLDMLFTPEKFFINKSPTFNLIKENSHYFISKNVSSFIGYTRQQASRYGVKGFRVRALKDTLDFLNQFNDFTRLHEHENEINIFIKESNTEHIKLTNCNGPNGTLTPHLEICTRKIPLHATVKYTKQIFQKLYDEYGHRAKLAETNQGVDWKALMHAVRVAHEAKELLLTGHITFPRPEKELLLKIRKAEMQYKEVEIIIEEGLNTLLDTQIKSKLRENPDLEKADELVYNIYRGSI